MFCPLGIELGQVKLFYLMTVKLILNIQQEMNKVQISVAQHFDSPPLPPPICRYYALELHML